ncbi:MAG: penicillin-binding transpeptidase domain-containing protein [Sedimenticola sp.]
MAGKKRQKRAAKALKQEKVALPSYRARRWTLLTLMGLASVALVWRAVDQQIFETDFLQTEGERRHLRVVEMSAHRGMINDRHGEPLAISTPVDSIWANPRVLSPDRRVLAPLAKVLGKGTNELRRLLAQRSNRSFVYLQRRVNPDLAEKVMALDIDGVELQREFRRYYPAGEIFSHVVGFTNVDDQGQEGLELAFDQWLQGKPGKKRVIRDGRARAVKDVESIQKPTPGKNLTLSLDRRLQFLAYRELKAAVKRHKAKSASAVMLDARTGEVLAMVNQPSYNPNGSKSARGGRFRNRALTDVFEPGSTMKPFTVTAALESGRYRPGSAIDTTPGFYKVGRHQIKDNRNYGKIDVETVLRKSSNVGASKIALDLPREELWNHFFKLGFGDPTNTGFPGEVSGQLTPHLNWTKIDHATLSFGYGLSVTPLQLARAYAVLAADGIRYPVSLLRLEERPRGERVMSVGVARDVRRMLKAVVSTKGTAPEAAVAGYQVAGKTGTVKKITSSGYSEDKYLAVFAGMAPVSDPRLVMVVMIDEPRAGEYYGGQVAAPVFSKVMAGALRLLNVAPDNLPNSSVRLAGLGGEQ